MDSKRFGIILVIFIICSVYKVRSSGIGGCPKHEYLKHFNVSKFAGQWFEVERSFYLMELTSACVTIDLKENERGQLEVDVTTYGRWSGIPHETKGIAMKSKKDPSIYSYRVNSRLPKSIAKLLPGGGFYQILNTDYNNFAILWTCSSALFAHTDLIWILSRKREIDVHSRAQIYEFLASKRIDSERLVLSRNNCTNEVKN